MIEPFLYDLPTKIYFGFGKLDELPGLLKDCGVQRAVLVCDRFFAEKGEALRQSAPQITAVFSDVEPNPQRTNRHCHWSSQCTICTCTKSGAYRDR